MKPSVPFYKMLVKCVSIMTASMIKAICSVLVIVTPCLVKAQDTVSVTIDSIQLAEKTKDAPASLPSSPVEYAYNKKRVRIIAAANIIGYAATTLALYNTWYKDYPQTSFHTFNDIAEWKQMDKIGHVYSSYVAGRESMELWRWTGISRNKRIWFGGMSGALYLTTIEVLDGFSTQWGWSWSDFGANMAGSGMLVAQELAWNEQLIQLKWSFHRKHYQDPALNARSNEVFGSSTPERILKDYNGQTYWLSVAPASFINNSKLPAWLQISVGTGVEGLFGARQNVGKDTEGNITFYRPDIRRYRQWYLAPDIDLTKIKTKSKALRFAFDLLNIFKFPTPSLEYSNGKMRWNWIHF